MFKKTISTFSIFCFLVTVSFLPSDFALANNQGDTACEQKAAEGADEGGEQAGQKKCDDQDNADNQFNQDLGNTASDMGGGGGGALMGGLLGGALGALGAMMAMKKSTKDLEKKAKEAEDRINKKIDEKFEQAQEANEKKLDEIKDELGGSGDGTQGEAPTIGASGLAKDIEDAFASSDLNKVQEILNDPLNRERLPDSYIQEIEQRLAAAGGGSISQASADSVLADIPTSVSQVVEEAGQIIPVSDGIDELGNSIFNSARKPAMKPVRVTDIKELVDGKMVEQTRLAVLEMIESGQMSRINAAAKHINMLELSSDNQMISLGYELKNALNIQLEKMGLPTGNLGIGLLLAN